MWKYKKIIKWTLVVSSFIMLMGCGLSNEEKKQIEKDKPIARELAIDYIKDKYDIKANVVDIYSTHKTIYKQMSYEGSHIVEIKDKQKTFYVWVNVKDKMCSDNYQNDEIKKDIAAYVEKQTNGKTLGINLETYKDKNISVSDKTINKIYQNTAFFHSTYEKEQMVDFISHARVEVLTVNANLQNLNETIMKVASQYQNKGEFYIYDLSKKEYFDDLIEEKFDVDKQEALLDESLEHKFIEVDEDIQTHSYVKYQHQMLNNISIAYAQSMEVTLEEPKIVDFFQEIKENQEIFEEVKGLKIKQIIKLSTSDQNISGMIAIDGRVSDDYAIYQVYEQDGKMHFDDMYTKAIIKGRKTYFFFNSYEKNPYVLLVKL